MNLRNKKELAARALKVGKERIMFVEARRDEIKEAITKQDIRDLHADGAIRVKEISGRKAKVKKKGRRTTGKIRKKVNTRKQDYVIMTRKLRGYTAEMKKQGKVSPEEVKEIRKRIRNRIFRSKAHLKDYIENKDKYSSSMASGTSTHKTKKKKVKKKKK
jgi:large subunit ribosomal protein L19e